MITLTEHFIRHGNHLTHVSVVNDPIYLTEPLIKSQDYVLNANSNANWLWPCEYVDEAPGPPARRSPQFPAGRKSVLNEFAAKYEIPGASRAGRSRRPCIRSIRRSSRASRGC